MSTLPDGPPEIKSSFAPYGISDPTELTTPQARRAAEELVRAGMPPIPRCLVPKWCDVCGKRFSKTKRNPTHMRFGPARIVNGERVNNRDNSPVLYRICRPCINTDGRGTKKLHARLFPKCEPWHDMFDHVNSFGWWDD